MALAAKNPHGEPPRIFRRPCATRKISAPARPAQPQPTEQLYWLGIALNAQAKTKEAATTWQRAITAAAGKDDVFSALALRKLGRKTPLGRCWSAGRPRKPA